MIDYLQLIEPDNPKDPRQEQVAKIARRLKGLARELKVPVLVPGPAQPAGGGRARQQAAAQPSCASRAPSSRTPTW